MHFAHFLLFLLLVVRWGYFLPALPTSNDSKHLYSVRRHHHHRHHFFESKAVDKTQPRKYMKLINVFTSSLFMKLLHSVLTVSS